MKCDKLPPFERLRIEQLLQFAENCRDVTTYDSNNKGFGYIADLEGRLLIITRKQGRLLLNYEELEPMLEELQNIKEDIERWKRNQRISGLS